MAMASIQLLAIIPRHHHTISFMSFMLFERVFIWGDVVSGYTNLVNDRWYVRCISPINYTIPNYSC